MKIYYRFVVKNRLLRICFPFFIAAAFMQYYLVFDKKLIASLKKPLQPSTNYVKPLVKQVITTSPLLYDVQPNETEFNGSFGLGHYR